MAGEYVPRAYREPRVVFILKLGRHTHASAKDFRPSVLEYAGATGRQIYQGWYSQVGPLHPNQHGYQTAKSIEPALHSAVSKVIGREDEVAIGTLVGIERVFKNNSVAAISQRAKETLVPEAVVGWISGMLAHRVLRVTRGSTTVKKSVGRGYPQGGVYPLHWCLVVDELDKELDEARCYAQIYEDVRLIFMTGVWVEVLLGLAITALRLVKAWSEP